MSGLMNLITVMGARGRCGFEVVEVVKAEIGEERLEKLRSLIGGTSIPLLAIE